MMSLVSSAPVRCFFSPSLFNMFSLCVQLELSLSPHQHQSCKFFILSFARMFVASARFSVEAALPFPFVRGVSPFVLAFALKNRFFSTQTKLAQRDEPRGRVPAYT